MPLPLIRLTGVAAFALIAATALRAQGSVDDFFRDFSAEWIRANPNQATATRYFTGPEQDRLERQLTPVTAEWRRARVVLARRGLAELDKCDRRRMTDVQRVSADVMHWQLNVVVDGAPFEEFAFPLEQFAGVNVDLVNSLTVGHPLLTEKDAENYLARLAQVSDRMGEAIAVADRLIGNGLFPPRFIVRATIAQVQQFVEAPPAGNPFVTAFAARMATVKAIPDGRREALRAEAERIVGAQVYPAWKKAIALLEPLVGRATDDAGLWRFKDGSAAYAYFLRRFTTTRLTADEIHEIGLREVARIEAEMDAVFRRLGRTSGSVKDRVEQLKKDLAYPTTEDGRRLIMADVEKFMRDAEARAALQFDRRPRAAVIAQPYPRFREANAAASYNAPARDGSRPGTFQIPLRPEQMTRFALRTLVYHETVPGHHFQLALELENETTPRFRQVRAFGAISALSEGWALYAERLAADSGWYDDDPEGLLGQLDDELFRARRLVVDTGLHAKRWTRQQAIDYGIEASEVERYVVNPGQACSYMIGQLKIIELREKARKTLGGAFSLKEFHSWVLGTGTAPLDVLEQQVDSYIRSATARR
ncbi:MAG: DUF885 domain-containing protein [Acidobacteria bacterium]|nr:MAG: DUF885 domain-containing protein [Acidobacteriota bacterium]